MKRRRRRDRTVPPEEQRDLRVVLETHLEPLTPVEKRRLGIVKSEWQD